jgi:hypothetical protein
MVEGRTECTAHLLPVPSYTSPHDGAEEQGRGRGGAGWLAGYLGRTGFKNTVKYHSKTYSK